MKQAKPECPHRCSIAVVDYISDKVYEGPDMCTLVDKPCLLETGDACEIYTIFLEETEAERRLQICLELMTDEEKEYALIHGCWPCYDCAIPYRK